MNAPVLKVGVIGMGNVGPALASALRASGSNIVGVAARSQAARDRAEVMLPAVPIRPPSEVAKQAEVLFLAVSDDQIEPLTKSLVEDGSIRPGQVVAHVWGGGGIKPLESAARIGAITIALHPAMTFTGTSLDVQRLMGCPIAFTCSPVAEPIAKLLIEALGGIAIPVREDDRVLYHAGLVHASNHLLTLILQGSQILEEIGVVEPSDVLRPLVLTAAERALDEGLRGLTGPVARGDWDTVSSHLEALGANPTLANLQKSYRNLSEATSDLIRERPAGPRIVRTQKELLAALSEEDGPISLVMTMGALHEGHLSLVEQARAAGGRVVVTIFVNPAQFSPSEDLAEYPRTLDADVEALRKAGADLVYVPEVEEVYPAPPSVNITPGPAATVLEGAFRPGHFAGVLQIVGKMFNLIRPTTAIFGQKDAQQFANIAQMVRDLDYPIELIEAPILRAESGLALSSRNQYLSDNQRAQATALFQSLTEGARTAMDGATADAIVAATAEKLREATGITPEYVALASRENFTVMSYWSDKKDAVGVTPGLGTETRGAAYLLVAAKVGSTRLIDNVFVEVNPDD